MKEQKKARTGIRRNKEAVVAAVAERLNTTKEQARMFIDATFDVIADALYGGDAVAIAKFGSFRPVRKPKRTCRNPATGGTMVVDERIKVCFQPAKRLAKEVNSINRGNQEG